MFDLGEVQALTRRGAEPCPDLSSAACIDLIRALEELKCVAESAQAVLAVVIDTATRDAEARQGVVAAQRGRGVASQIALARRESERRGRQHLGLAKILHREMPHTLAAFRAGKTTEWRATLLARETACLSRDDRATIDQKLAEHHETLEQMGDGTLIAEARKLAYKLDAQSFVEKRARAEAERRVTSRPAPDTMSHVSALLPVKDGVAVVAALGAAADALVAAGDGRSRNQLMADVLVERVTDAAGAAKDGRAPWTCAVIVPDAVLTGQLPGSGYVEGHGPVPADLAAEIAADATWLRRLYATPGSGTLVSMDSRRRLFPPGLAQFLRHRDRTCRMPWCDAPIRHADHVEAVADGGPTTVHNGQGLCAAHDFAKQAPGWHARARPGPHHLVDTTTPTGHVYTSAAPAALEPDDAADAPRPDPDTSSDPPAA